MNKKKYDVEILAPAGGEEQLTAAVRTGADAVYFGAGNFNARRNAKNFCGEELYKAVAYCHERNVKAYITLNTLITDSEIAEMEETLRLICNSGADAVLTQDMAVAAAVKKHCPSMPLHASTQMAVHNLSGVRELESMGFSRIVLAREMSLKEIAYICRNTKAEIEVFVHGAHCMSVSGMCYMSSMLGARSGNRGLCAQPCRLNFKVRDRQYALSLKDMCLTDRVEALAAAGVKSLKIEGRMKRPEYVAAAVSAYRTAAEGNKPDTQSLRDVFSRSGFTSGYADGKISLDMFGYRTKEDVTAAAPVLKSLANLYKSERQSVPLQMKFTAKKDIPCSLTLSDGANTLKAEGDIPQTAINVALSAEAAERSLSKLGGTPYYADSIECDIGDGLSLTASGINSLRRALTDKLSALRAEPARRKYDNDIKDIVCAPAEKPESPAIRLRFENASQIWADAHAEKIILPLKEIVKNPALIQRFGNALAAEVPVLLFPAAEKQCIDSLLSLKAQGLKSAVCENIGTLRLARGAGLKVSGGHMLNILNSEAAKVYNSLGVNDITLSAELSFPKIRALCIPCKTGIIAYGHLPLMRFRCCPMKYPDGCRSCDGRQKVTDRLGYEFTVLCSDRKYSSLLNFVPLYVGDKSVPPLDFTTLYFTTESADECKNVYETYKYRKYPPFKRTTGLYNKELL